MSLGRITCIHASLLAALCLLSGCGGDRASGSTSPKDYRARMNEAIQKKARNETLYQIAGAVNRFRDEVGRLPTNLNEIVDYGYMPRIPKAPDGMAYYYNSAAGNVTMGPPPAQGGLNSPPEADFRSTLSR